MDIPGVTNKTAADARREIILKRAPEKFIIGGLLAVLVGGLFYFSLTDLKHRGVRADGEIVSYHKTSEPEENDPLAIFKLKQGYRPVVSFSTPDGKTHAFESTDVEPAPAHVGQRVQVIYRADNPLISAVVGTEDSGGWALGLIALGLSMFLLGMRQRGWDPNEPVAPEAFVEETDADLSVLAALEDKNSGTKKAPEGGS